MGPEVLDLLQGGRKSFVGIPVVLFAFQLYLTRSGMAPIPKIRGGQVPWSTIYSLKCGHGECLRVTRRGALRGRGRLEHRRAAAPLWKGTARRALLCRVGDAISFGENAKYAAGRNPVTHRVIRSTETVDGYGHNYP